MDINTNDTVLVTRAWMGESRCIAPIASLQGTGLPFAGYGMGSGTAFVAVAGTAAAPKHVAPKASLTAVRQDADRARPRGSTL